MNMNWFMLIRIEIEDKTKILKILGIALLFIYHKDI